MIPPEIAWSRIAERCSPLGPESVPRRQALGRRLTEPIVATTELPPFDTSALDGFAYAGDRAPGSTLPISSTIAAGDAPGGSLAAGTAARIFTGAPVPPGADRVVAIERTEADGERVRLLEPPSSGAAIRRRGEVLEAGAPLLEAGTHLGPAALSLLASQGIETVRVRRLPEVAVVPTGDEVVAPDQRPAPGQLRDSHSDFLLAAGSRMGLAFRGQPIAPDDPERLEAAIGACLEQNDVVLVCGGVSMGGRDHTEAVLRALGAEIVFSAVAVQPGKPLVFAIRGTTLLFGLPGNPVSVMVAFRLFVAPTLRRLAGDAECGFWSEAGSYELATALPAGKSRDRFVPGRVLGPGRRRAEPTGLLGSHDLLQVARAGLLLRIPAGAPPRQAGEIVEAMPWE